MRTPLLTLALAALPTAASAQNLDLDVSGGLSGETWNFTVTGAAPGQFWVLAFADTMGPLPIAILDPLDARSFSLDFGMFLYDGAWGTAPPPNPAMQILNVYHPTFAGFHVYAQAFTLPGNPTLIDQLSNNVVVQVAPGHGASVDTLGGPSRTRAFMPGARLPNGDHVVFGGNDGALQGGTYLKSVDRYRRKMLDVVSTPDVPVMGTERAFAAAVALDNGRVLVCGGNDDLNNVQTSAELYDPATNTIQPTGSMAQKRYFHSLVKLADGRVMALGGSTAVNASGTAFDAAIAIVNSATDSAEIYNPATGLWSAAAPMPWKRTGTTAVALSNGKVLVATGAGPGILSIPSFFRDAALYTPSTNTWQTIAQVPGNSRALATAAKLSNGKVLLSGGCQGNILSLTLNSLTDVHVFDPSNNSWATGPALSTARTGHTATLLPDGRLALCGGASGDVLFPSVTKSVVATDGVSWTSLGSMNHERAFHYAALTEDGQRLFLYGGIESGGIAAIQASCEQFAP